MSDILHEVDEALKQERILKIWQSYGSYIIAALVLVVLMTAAKSGYEYYHRVTSERATTALLNILETSEDKAADLKRFAETTKGKSTVIAQLLIAGDALENDDITAARAAYDTLANDNSAPSFYKDFGKLMTIQIDMDGINEENTAALTADLTALMDDKKSVWRYHALLNRASIFAMQGNYQDAIADVSAVRAGANVIPSLAQRAGALEQLYTIRKEETDS